MKQKLWLCNILTEANHAVIFDLQTFNFTILPINYNYRHYQLQIATAMFVEVSVMIISL